MKKVTLGMVLLAFSVTAAATAGAEENGYWREMVDSEGRTIQVFTYTSSVEITIADEGCGCPLDEEETGPVEMAADGEIHAVVEAPVRLAGTDAAPLQAAANPMTGIAVFGVVWLALLGFALYKSL